MRYKDLSSPEFPVAENDANRIMHIAWPIRNSGLLMASDVLEIMDRNTISTSVESREEADKLFNGLSEGEKIEMPIADGPLGSYFGMLADKFGIQWMVDFTQNITGKSS